MNIGFIGNFEAPFSTENDRKWSFNMLGHNVFAFQENKTDAKTIMEYVDKVEMLVYSHTHGWEIEGLEEVFSFYYKSCVPTVSVHLDRWAWLERAKDVGKEATWKTEYLFMADFSPEAQELYKTVLEPYQKVFYLKPGVIARDCYMAAPDPIRFPHEIVFVGSDNYHSEYPFRKELVEWLHKTYGDRFGHYGGSGYPGLRGHDLNVLYATAKIVVGDSCFGGRPNYVSDRYYETRGRGGFLIHPDVEGVDDVGVRRYISGDLRDLGWVIEQYLRNEEHREMNRRDGFEWVKNNETYTHRAQEIIEKVFNAK